MDLNCEGFQMMIGVEEVVNSNRREFHVMADEDGDATSSAILPITSQKSESRKRRVRIV